MTREPRRCTAANRHSCRVDKREQFLTTPDLARRWQIAVRTLRDQRANGQGCPFVRVSPRVVRYRLADVEAYEADHFINPPQSRVAVMTASAP